MYDYGARFYMPDIGRWGVVDPRSQYTHEAYSYVWNNPIFFNDPTGMEGELAICPTCPNTSEFQRFINDKHNEFSYDSKSKTVSIVTPIEEVTITAYKPIENKSADVQVTTATILGGIAVGGRSTPNPSAWLAAGGATLLMMLTNQSDVHFPIGYTTQIPIWPSRSNPNEDDTDINGVPVPVDDSGYKKPVDQTIEKGGNRFNFAKEEKIMVKQTILNNLELKKKQALYLKKSNKNLKGMKKILENVLLDKVKIRNDK